MKLLSIHSQPTRRDSCGSGRASRASDTRLLLLQHALTPQVRVFKQNSELAIPDGRNLHQKLQALAIIKIQISIHQKKALGKLCRTITVGRCDFR